MRKQTRLRIGLSFGAGLIAVAALAAAGHESCDDLAGLRPSTDGVETNAFWDTRAHVAYAVSFDRGVNTNVLSSMISSCGVSEVGDIARNVGLMVIIQ